MWQWSPRDIQSRDQRKCGLWRINKNSYLQQDVPIALLQFTPWKCRVRPQWWSERVNGWIEWYCVLFSGYDLMQIMVVCVCNLHLKSDIFLCVCVDICVRPTPSVILKVTCDLQLSLALMTGEGNGKRCYVHSKYWWTLSASCNQKALYCFSRITPVYIFPCYSTHFSRYSTTFLDGTHSRPVAYSAYILLLYT